MEGCGLKLFGFKVWVLCCLGFEGSGYKDPQVGLRAVYGIACELLKHKAQH